MEAFESEMIYMDAPDINIKVAQIWHLHIVHYFRVRYMQDSIDRKLLVRLMNTWKEKFQIRVKENSAHNHFR